MQCRERPLAKTVRSVNVRKDEVLRDTITALIQAHPFCIPTNFFSSNKRVSVGFTVCLSRNVNVALSFAFVYFSSSSTGQSPGVSDKHLRKFLTKEMGQTFGGHLNVDAGGVALLAQLKVMLH